MNKKKGDVEVREQDGGGWGRIQTFQFCYHPFLFQTSYYRLSKHKLNVFERKSPVFELQLVGLFFNLAVFSFYFCITNYHKFNDLKQHSLIITQFLWAMSWYSLDRPLLRVTQGSNPGVGPAVCSCWLTTMGCSQILEAPKVPDHVTLSQHSYLLLQG